MHIKIDDNTTIQNVQQTFSDYYPYLRLAFYKKPHEKYAVSSEYDLISPDTVVKSFKKTHTDGILEIVPLQKVADVENELFVRFGLSAQVLQKEKDQWVQTAGKDDFTLKELNEFSRNAEDDLIVDEYAQGFQEPPEESPTPW